MRLYEFDDKDKFPVYSIIFANNESEAMRKYYTVSQYVGYYVPQVLDIDRFYSKLVEDKQISKFSSFDKFKLQQLFYDLIDKCCNSKIATIIV